MIGRECEVEHRKCSSADRRKRAPLKLHKKSNQKNAKYTPACRQLSHITACQRRILSTYSALREVFSTQSRDNHQLLSLYFLKSMKMWSLPNLLFLLCIALSCVTSAAKLIHVFGYEGKEAQVSCSYGAGYESYEKYLCRNDCKDEDVLITTPEQMKSKYSISDDRRKRVFTTTISNLRNTDAGKYWCGVSRTGTDIFTEVKLEVVTDRCCDSSTTVQSYEGGSVSIICPYESQYQSNVKYICRGNTPSTCLQQALVTSDKTPNTKFSLTDDKSGNVTVTVTGVTRSDSGSYLCGVQRNSGLDVFSAVVLEVKENRCCDSSTTVQSYEGVSVSIICPYESQYQRNKKYICRGNTPSTCLQQALVTSDKRPNTKFSLTDDKSRRFTVTVTGVTQRDSGSYLCGVQRNPGLDVFSAVVLEVKEAEDNMNRNQTNAPEIRQLTLSDDLRERNTAVTVWDRINITLIIFLLLCMEM
ncbi:hypothetical protein Q5P01_026304 [Channa striata]|uniref:Ig-like domain-containing protein n=1 Tax=Channa striata TaxID=64152 RepID=A0AA88LKD0_CHASR|nr:hypothetical protein Q5P01_026304 [Channa striata]